MKYVVIVAALVMAPAAAAAADKPDWAFPVTESVQPPPRIEGTRVRPPPPGSTLSITRAKADDMYDIPNWYPDRYPPMPKIVQFGDKEREVRACGSCHLPVGTGHDESAYVAGLPAAYIIRQFADWKNGDRKYGGRHGRHGQGHSRRRAQGCGELFRLAQAAGPGSAWWRPTPYRDLCRPRQQAAGSPRRRHRAAGQPHHRGAGETRRSWSTAIRALVSSPMCRRAASPRARIW